MRFIERLRGEGGLSSPRAKGTIVACDLQTDESGGYQHTAAQRARDFFVERGVLLRPLGNVVYFMPPYCVSDEELARGYDAIVAFA